MQLYKLTIFKNRIRIIIIKGENMTQVSPANIHTEHLSMGVRKILLDAIKRGLGETGIRNLNQVDLNLFGLKTRGEEQAA